MIGCLGFVNERKRDRAFLLYSLHSHRSHEDDGDAETPSPRAPHLFSGQFSENKLACTKPSQYISPRSLSPILWPPRHCPSLSPSLSLVKFIRAVIIAAIMSGCISPKQSLYSSPLKGKDRRRSLPLPRARRGGERSRLMARKVICMEIWRPCARPPTGHPDSLSSDDRAANVVWRTHCLLMLIDFDD